MRKNTHEHIENVLSSEVDTNILARLGFVSRDKLYADFYSTNGHSVKEYIRKRRLSNAMALIKTSEMPFEDIAYKCGYSSYLALWRAVKKTLGITPSEYKNSDVYYFFPPSGGELSHAVTVASDTMPNLLCLKFYTRNALEIENRAVTIFLKAFPDYNGRIFGRNGQAKGRNLCYELYLTNFDLDYNKLEQHGFELAHEMSCVSSVFATTVVANNEQQINGAWDYLYSGWLHKSMFEYTGEPYYEEYLVRGGKAVKLKLYLPIKRRACDVKITLINNPCFHFVVAKANGYNAEQMATETVINYFEAKQPHKIKAHKKFYVQKGTDYYVCGIKVKAHMLFDKDDDVEYITTAHNKYLVLESNVMGDYDGYSDMLTSFAEDNGIEVDKHGIFVVYDATDSYTNARIKMYCPINI